MRTQLFDVPGSLRVEYQEHKEGPSPVYVVWKPGTCKAFQERGPLLKFAQWPASTPTGRRLRDWLDELQPHRIRSRFSKYVVMLFPRLHALHNCVLLFDAWTT